MYTVDASVWVNAFDQREPGHLVSRQFLEVLRSQALPIIVPNVVLVEVAGAISRTRDLDEAQAAALVLPTISMVAYEDVGVRLGRKVGYRAPVGLGGCLERSQPSPLGWAEGAQAFGPESRRWLRDLAAPALAPVSGARSA